MSDVMQRNRGGAWRWDAKLLDVSDVLTDDDEAGTVNRLTGFRLVHSAPVDGGTTTKSEGGSEWMNPFGSSTKAG